ncbi:Putative exonuclease mut-7 like [Glycine soja]|nr:Putative exonuclease mut-7 like [Glycine soja]
MDELIIYPNFNVDLFPWIIYFLKKVEPYLDIKSVYNHLQHNKKHVPKQSKSLSTICAEVLGFSLSKELQCSDWSHRPLTEEQITYAAMDAHCLLDIFEVFQAKVVKEGL